MSRLCGLAERASSLSNISPGLSGKAHLAASRRCPLARAGRRVQRRAGPPPRYVRSIEYRASLCAAAWQVAFAAHERQRANVCVFQNEQVKDVSKGIVAITARVQRV